MRQQAVSLSAWTAIEAGSSDDEELGQSNTWCPLLEATDHYSIGGHMAMCMCHRSKTALSPSCHFVVFVNPVAHASTDRFFTFCDEHLTQECDSAASACDSGTSGPCHRSIVVLTDSRGAFFEPHTAGELRFTLPEGPVLLRGSPLVYERAPHIH